MNGVTNLGSVRLLPVLLLPPISALGNMPSEIRVLGCGVAKRKPGAVAGVRIGLARFCLTGSRPFRVCFGVVKG